MTAAFSGNSKSEKTEFCILSDSLKTTIKDKKVESIEERNSY